MDKLGLEALNRYFTHLELFGYVNQCIVNDILTYLFIVKLIHEYRCFINKCDAEILNNALACLNGKNCFLPLEYNLDCSYTEDVIVTPEGQIIRLAEDNDIRLTEEEELRLLMNS